MKNQYFGDIRDLFKFDLIEKIVLDRQLGLNKFLYVIMHTKDNGKGGLKRDFKKVVKDRKPGIDNKPLFAECEKQTLIPSIKRMIGGSVTKFFENYISKPLIIECINDSIDRDTDKYFNETYYDYFERVTKIIRNSSEPTLVFLDPDTGLEPECQKGAEYVSFETVHSLYNSMNSDSIVMIYQHGTWQRQHKKKVLEKFAKNVLWISDKEIGFFFLSHSQDVRDRLFKMFASYKELYPDWVIFE